MNKRIYMPSALIETKEKQSRAWAIGEIGDEEKGFYRGPFFSEEEALECIPEDSNQGIYYITSNGPNVLSWIWREAYWEKV